MGLFAGIIIINGVGARADFRVYQAMQRKEIIAAARADIRRLRKEAAAKRAAKIEKT